MRRWIQRDPRSSERWRWTLGLVTASLVISNCTPETFTLPLEFDSDEDLPSAEELIESISQDETSPTPGVSAAVVPGNQISVIQTGTSVNGAGQPIAVFDATWSNLQRKTFWIAWPFPRLQGTGFRGIVRCGWGSRRGQGCTTPGQGSTFTMRQTTFDYTVRFYIWQQIPLTRRPFGPVRIAYIGFITFVVPAAGQNQSPTASFTSTCTDLNCAFDGSASSDPDGSISSYDWSFGDGTTAVGATPNHAYGAPGTYTVGLTVTDDDGATATATRQVTVVAANQPPVASFTSACVNLDCTFDATSSSDPDGTISSYVWDFGDGNAGTGMSPAHSFAAGGSYGVTLTVTDDDGASDSDTQQVMVTAANQPPAAGFSPNCADLDCTFDASASNDPDGTISSYVWDFGDGNAGTGASPAHTYATGGTYAVTLTVTDDDGATDSDTQQVTVMPGNQSPTASYTSSCTDLNCTFDASASSDPDGTIASYSWDFGDGSNGTGATPTHTYASAGTYTVVLTVVDDDGATGMDTQQVSVTAANQAPTASYISSCVDLDCAFDGSGSSDADGTIASYAWDFGDGNNGSGATPTHTYAAGGTYTVVLTVTDDDGDTGTDSQQITATAANQAPTASYSSSCVDLDCSFDGSASADPDGTIAAYAWDFGDGNSGSGATSAHTYGAAGTYTVVLTVTDDAGDTGTDSQQITVTAPNQPPTASYAPSCVDLSCTFDGSASSDPDGTIAVYAWDFGDGNAGSGATPNHTFASAGTYTVVLTVTDDDGDTGTDSQSVTVTPPLMGQVGATIPGELADERFGRSLAISDDGLRFVAGAPRHGGAATFGGRVRAFEWDGTTWNLLGAPWDGGTNGFLGEEHTIAMSGDGSRVAIGVHRASLNVGSVSVYEFSGSTWQQIGQTITKTGLRQLGYAVSLSTSGDRIAIGAPNSGTFGNADGITVVYELSGGSWTQMGNDILGEAPGDRSGSSVAISGDGARIAIGGPGNDNGSSGSGHIRVYDWNGAAWVQVGGDMDGNGLASNELFGTSVDLSRDGARVVGFGTQSGDYAKVFELVGGSWTQMGPDFVNAVAFDIHQPVSLSSDGSRVSIGFPFGGTAGRGLLRSFDWTGSSWVQVGTDIVGDQNTDNLGWAAVISATGNRVVVGMPQFDNGMATNDNRGGVRVFTVP